MPNLTGPASQTQHTIPTTTMPGDNLFGQSANTSSNQGQAASGRYSYTAPSHQHHPAKGKQCVMFTPLRPEHKSFSMRFTAQTNQRDPHTSSLLTEPEDEINDVYYDLLPSTPELPQRMPAAPMTFGALASNMLDMPLCNSREAPKTFKGKHEEVQYSIQHYD
ncbi:hypothetical protein C8R45DRAFT_1104278 [Mycena sanguinolenta]|nr:hypothetical protein C8R45DRAFT_1104278 [Mycena sanguinolenta]